MGGKVGEDCISLARTALGITVANNFARTRLVNGINKHRLARGAIAVDQAFDRTARQSRDCMTGQCAGELGDILLTVH